LLVVKVAATESGAAAIARFTELNFGVILDETGNSRTLQFTGRGSHIGAVLTELAAMTTILELARSGTAALELGESVLAPADLTTLPY
jgi:acetolactate synthase-1/3 small subunit